MCSYCGCESISVIGRFMTEHVEIINACGDLRRAVSNGGDVPGRAADVAALLEPHTEGEEVGLFTVMRRRDEFNDHIGTLCGEHRTLDQLLAAIAAGEHHLMDTFERVLRDHIDKEDNGLFPAAALGLDGEEWSEIDTVTHELQHAVGIPHQH